MSNLLPVGTRVKIVGPDCIGGKSWIGGCYEIETANRKNEPRHAYSILTEHGRIWLPESSIQEIKEQTVKIENETQYQKVKAYVKAEKELCEAFTHKSECGPCRDMIHFAFDGDAQAALAAYESRDKVREIAEGLSELERAVLVQSMCGRREIDSAISSLKKKDLVDNSDTIACTCNALPLGNEVAAYLRSQKRELKWEVWRTNDGTGGAFRGAFAEKSEAVFFCRYKNDCNSCASFEVREVK